LRVGLIGCGAIGGFLAETIAGGGVPGAVLTAIADRAERRAAVAATAARLGCAFTDDALALPTLGVELVVEAGGGAGVRELAVPLVRAGLDLLLLSVGALADPDLRAALSEAAAAAGRSVHVPSGAIGGLDALRAAAVAGLDEVVLTTRKPPAALAGAPHWARHPLDLAALAAPTVVFEGNAAAAIAAFPANVNVALAVSLAGIGPERTRVRVVADPALTRNVHELTARGAFGELHLEIANEPSPDNPRTSRLAALSAVAALRRLTAPLQVGS
jgi:aspartate dehydrogenase